MDESFENCLEIVDSVKDTEEVVDILLEKYISLTRKLTIDKY
jgi:hypothetical protein